MLKIISNAAVGRGSATALNQSGTETILLVDDTQEVREVAAFALRRAGYTVLEAGGGDEAFAVCGRHEGALDCLVTDIVMPGLTGHDLAARLKTVRPSLACVFVSGCLEGLESDHAPKGAIFLQKPFTPAALLQTVRSALGR